MENKQRFREKIYFFLFTASAFGTLVILFLSLLLLFISGIKVVNLNFLLSSWNHLDISKGGIYPAIIGSFYLGIGVILISFPLGVATALFLTEYNKNSSIRKLIQLAIRNLAGVPSIVYGLFGLALFVNFLSFGTSLLSAILTLSIMTLPWIITASVEALEAIPHDFRESSYALGATQKQTIAKIIIPAAMPGCITGAIISNARALGETAPIITVGATFYLSTLPSSIMDKFMALPYHTFILATQHSSPYAISYSAATALVLIFLIFLLNLGGIFIRLYYRRKKDW